MQVMRRLGAHHAGLVALCPLTCESGIQFIDYADGKASVGFKTKPTHRKTDWMTYSRRLYLQEQNLKNII